jgi:hypothetical protein
LKPEKTILPINSLQFQLSKEGNFDNISKKYKKNLTLNPSFSLEPPPPPGFDFLSQKPAAQPIFAGCLSIFSTKTGASIFLPFLHAISPFSFPSPQLLPTPFSLPKLTQSSPSSPP